MPILKDPEDLKPLATDERKYDVSEKLSRRRCDALFAHKFIF